MEALTKRACQSLLIGGSLLIGNISVSHAAIKNTVSLTATGLSAAVVQKPSPAYLLAMANNLQLASYSASQPRLVVSLLEQAAKQGLAEAQFRLGNLFLDSDILEEDENKAMYWMDQAAEQGHAQAQFIFEKIMNNGFDIGC